MDQEEEITAGVSQSLGGKTDDAIEWSSDTLTNKVIQGTLDCSHYCREVLGRTQSWLREMAGLGFAKNAICQNMTERTIAELVKSEGKHTARNIAKRANQCFICRCVLKMDQWVSAKDECEHADIVFQRLILTWWYANLSSHCPW